MSDNKNAFNAMKYPDGYNKVRSELLGFLPDDDNVREGFMKTALQWFIQW